jgi:hypothetical protein
MTEAANTSKTLVNLYQTTLHNNPEDSHHYFPHVVGKPNNKNIHKLWINSRHHNLKAARQRIPTTPLRYY